eukprot:TRINITY_DN3199_c0_g1_i14.p1 TRINITY_DN3199_c0_g1~~TRINITY_DN3199_c0_g1_i14.p1  ORF type:complete len:132 (+),score=21.16 TRINITY_DN3199_c0_g1_i14:671-1066(+)
MPARRIPNVVQLMLDFMRNQLAVPLHAELPSLSWFQKLGGKAAFLNRLYATRILSSVKERLTKRAEPMRLAMLHDGGTAAGVKYEVTCFQTAIDGKQVVVAWSATPLPNGTAKQIEAERQQGLCSALLSSV